MALGTNFNLPESGTPAPGPAPQPDALAFASQQLGFHPDPTQSAVLQSEAHRAILNCSRQWGKSTVAAVKAVHRAITRPGSLVLVASPGERQSAEFLRKAESLVRRLNLIPRGDGSNAISILFSNGSRIVGLPGAEATVRGFSAVSLLLIDEAARVDDAMYMALRPMLAVGGGDLWMMSTPFGRRGFFYETFTHESNWEKFAVPATACPRIEPHFLEEERRAMGPIWFAQEYLCEFVDNGSALFDRDMIEAMLDSELETLF